MIKKRRRTLSDPAPWICPGSAVAAFAFPALPFGGGTGIFAPALLAFAGGTGRTGFLPTALVALAGRTRTFGAVPARPAMAFAIAGALGARRRRGIDPWRRLGRAGRTHVAAAAGRMFGADVVAMTLGARGAVGTTLAFRPPVAAGAFRGGRAFRAPVPAFAFLRWTGCIRGAPFVGSSAGAAFLVGPRGRRTPLGFAILAPGRARRQHQGGRHVHRLHRPSSM